MTPAEAREIDRLEFEAECAAIRQRAYALAGRKTPIVITPEPKQAKQPSAINNGYVRPQPKLYSHAGLTMSVRDWADHLGILRATIAYRIRQHWPLEHVFARRNLRGQCRRGVAVNFAPSEGTGAGSTVQETTEITFQEKANS